MKTKPIIIGKVSLLVYSIAFPKRKEKKECAVVLVLHLVIEGFFFFFFGALIEAFECMSNIISLLFKQIKYKQF